MKPDIFLFGPVTSVKKASSDKQSPLRQAGAFTPITPTNAPVFFRHTLSIFLILALNAWAQDASVLVNTGDPMRVSYACGEEDLQWAGMDCPEDQPCPVYLELSAIAASGRKLVISGDLHTSSATLNSVLLMSADEGLSWKEPAARARGEALDQLQFLDSSHGWAAGETQNPLPRDPFLLITTDSGNSWRRSPVGEEGSVGSILNFHFDSPRHGELVIDAGNTAAGGRYVSYESETGGDSWTIRGKVSQMPRAKAPASESPDWRIRTGRDGKVWQIEKRTGEQWSSTAAFLIEVAGCTLKPGSLKEPDDKL